MTNFVSFSEVTNFGLSAGQKQPQKTINVFMTSGINFSNILHYQMASETSLVASVA